MNRSSLLFTAAFVAVCSCGVANRGAADEPESREVRFAKYLSGSQLVGKFTVDGVDKPPKTETYTISACEKLPSDDLYRFTARIKYGQVDQEVPLDLKVLWSGKTPVITLDSIWIPTMGTFDARVMFHGDRYAGTWQHGDKGGHMFGKVVQLEDSEKAAPESEGGDAESEGGDQ